MSRKNHHRNLQRFLVNPHTCGEKRRYATERQAQTIREEQELLNPGLRLRVYKCMVPGCGGWHLTRHVDVV